MTRRCVLCFIEATLFGDYWHLRCSLARLVFVFRSWAVYYEGNGHVFPWIMSNIGYDCSHPLDNSSRSELLVGE